MPDSIILDPHAVLDVKFNWTAWLQTSETINDPPTITVTGATKSTVTVSGGYVVVWISAASGSSGSVQCRITTNQGRTDCRTMTFTVLNR